MKGFCPLGSGSKGNCTYLGTDRAKILIDAGLSGKSTKERLEQINVDIADIDAILITHEHSDHILGLRVLALKYGIPVFANTKTAEGIAEFMRDCPKFKIFSTGETFEYKDLEVHPFSIQHDTLDPVAFTIKTDHHKIGICTDLGFATTLVANQLHDCDYLVLEANHQISMVHSSARPMIYKQRVLSRSGHLSNEACGNLLATVATPRLKKVYLAHLSSECNTPETALSVVKGIVEENGHRLNISVAPQNSISETVVF